MQRRKFSREFTLEAVNLVRRHGVSVSQAARDLCEAADLLDRTSNRGIPRNLRETTMILLHPKSGTVAIKH